MDEQQIETQEPVTHFIGDWACLVHGEALSEEDGE